MDLKGLDFSTNSAGFAVNDFCGDMDCGMPENRYPDHYICAGPVPGITEYCIYNNRIYRGPFPDGNAIANIDGFGRIHEGYFPSGECIACIGTDGRIYEGSFPGKCLGSIINGRITLDGNYFPCETADYNIL